PAVALRRRNRPAPRQEASWLGARYRSCRRRRPGGGPEAAPHARSDFRESCRCTAPADRSIRRICLEGRRMNRPQPQSDAGAVGAPDAILNALPHPVIVVAPDGRLANANVAAEAFFEASVPVLRRHLL